MPVHDFPEQAYRQAANTPDSFDYDAWTECFHERLAGFFTHACAALGGAAFVLMFFVL
jgi:hypothetical protein